MNPKKHPDPRLSESEEAVQIVKEVVGDSSSVSSVQFLEDHPELETLGDVAAREQVIEIQRLQKSLKLTREAMVARIESLCGATVTSSADLSESSAATLIADLRAAEHNAEKLAHRDGWEALLNA